MKSLYDAFRASLEKYPNYQCMRFEEKSWSYRQTQKRIVAAARKLRGFGVSKGDVVAVALPNCPESVDLFYAISLLGAISYNIHPQTPSEGISRFIEEGRAKLLICLNLFAADYRKELPINVPIIAVNPYRGVNLVKAVATWKMSERMKGIFPYAALKKRDLGELPNISEHDDAVYLNTGGTNGDPKIVRLSNLAINHVAKCGYELVGKGDVRDIKMLTAIPLFHVFGLAMGVHTPIYHGASTILMLRFNTKEAIRHIRKARATVIIGVRALYNALLAKSSFYGPWLTKQITAFIGGDSVPQSVLDRWNLAMEHYGSKARLYEGYGSTEIVVTNVNYDKWNKKGTIGKPIPEVTMAIIDPETKKPLQRNEAGEICIGGPSIMSGYLHDEKLTKESTIIIDGQKYFATKDYGLIDEDGYLVFRNRMRRIVKINGETLCPADIENVVEKINEVYDCYCYAVKNERKDAQFRIAIVMKRDAEQKAEMTISNIYAALSRELPPAYKPERIDVFEKLPRTAIGKIDAKKFQEMIGEEII